MSRRGSVGKGLRRREAAQGPLACGGLVGQGPEPPGVSVVEMQRRFHLTRGELFAYRAGSGRRENRVSRWAPPRAPGIARNVRAAAALAGWLWRAVRRADRARGGAHCAWRAPWSQTTDYVLRSEWFESDGRSKIELLLSWSISFRLLFGQPLLMGAISDSSFPEPD